jgi:cytochrome c-type biogenesis protein CcmH/NrfG
MSLNRTLRWICVVGLFALAFVPLIVSNHMFFPFITGKNFTFRILTELIFAAWVILAVTDPAYRPKKSWLGWAAIIFVAVMFLADVFSEYPYKSFWSNYERMEGWVTLAHLLGYGIVAATVLSRDLWDRLWQTYLGVSMAMILYSFLQVAGLLRIDQGANRIDATLGNSAYLAIYALFNAFVILLFLVRRREDFKPGYWFLALGFNVGFLGFIALHLPGNALTPAVTGALVGWSLAGLLIGDALLLASFLVENGMWFYGLLFVLEFFIMFETETRGALLGFIAGVALAGLLVGIFERERRWLKNTGWVILIALCLIGGLFIVAKEAPAQSAINRFVHSNDTLNRMASISLTDNTTQSRFILWGMAWQGFLERPILGWGQESFNYVFNKFYDPRLYGDEQWFDRAHDIIFDWLTAGGALGLLSYLALFGGTIWYIWKKNTDDTAGGNERVGNAFSPGERAVLTGLLVGYFINNIFVFDNITSYLFYVSIIAYVYGRRTMWFANAGVPAGPNLRSNQKEALAVANRFVAPITLIALILCLYVVNWRPLMANFDLIAALSASQGNTVEDVIAAYQKTLSYRSFGDAEVREQIFSSLDDLTGQINQQSQPDPNLVAAQNQLLAYVQQQAQIQISRTPNDARYYLLPGSVIANAGEYSTALPLLLKSQQLSPKKQTILFELASVYIGQGNFTQALATLKTAYELDTQFQTAQILYAAAAIYDKNITLATQILQGVPESTIVSSDPILHAFYFIGDYKDVVSMWKARVAAAPDNPQNYLSLAGSYLLIKDNTDAIAALQKAETIDPTFKQQGDQYIQEIRAGKIAQ